MKEEIDYIKDIFYTLDGYGLKFKSIEYTSFLNLIQKFTSISQLTSTHYEYLSNPLKGYMILFEPYNRVTFSRSLLVELKDSIEHLCNFYEVEFTYIGLRDNTYNHVLPNGYYRSINYFNEINLNRTVRFELFAIFFESKA